MNLGLREWKSRVRGRPTSEINSLNDIGILRRKANGNSLVRNSVLGSLEVVAQLLILAFASSCHIMYRRRVCKHARLCM
jgi:hypothetical protein